MNAPIYNFLRYYGNSDILRGHMPGHKGIPPFGITADNAYKYDITEIKGADSLFEANGIILESEKTPRVFTDRVRRYFRQAALQTAFRLCSEL